MTRLDPAKNYIAQGRPRRRVLVVDDSRLQRKILISLLSRWGFDVVEADCGESALALCAEAMPDLVLSDWMMPGMSGLELCRAFRGLSNETYGYFILLTSKTDTADLAEAFGSGADDFLSKPVNSDELRARITAGERILKMQAELREKNDLIGEALSRLQVLHAALDRDLLQARKLQSSLLSESHLDLNGWSVDLMSQSCGHVGGDLVGFYKSDDLQLGLYGLDVSGHGISAALMTARLAGYLSGSARSHNIALQPCREGFRLRPPDQAIALLNDLILAELETEHYLTLMLAHVDLGSGVVSFGQAGHPHPVIQRADGRIEQRGDGGFPVGLIADAHFSRFDAVLAPGDRLLILSDGVTECNDPGGTLLGEEGLAAILEGLNGHTGAPLLEALMQGLSDFAGGAPFVDDISGVLLERHTQE